MKRFIPIMIAVLALTACNGNKKDADSKKSVFITESLEKKFVITNVPDSSFWDNKELHYTQIDVLINWPETLAGETPKELQDSLLSAVFGTYRRADVPESLEALCAVPLGSDYAEGLTQKEVTEIPDSISGYSTLDIDASVASSSRDFVTYCVNYSYYLEGAAHGYYSETYVNYDLRGRKVITSERLFDKAKVGALKDAIFERIEQTSMPLVEKGADIESISNIMVDEGRVSFVFNPYEVAPYAAGVVTVDFDAQELQPYLSDYGRKLFAK